MSRSYVPKSGRVVGRSVGRARLGMGEGGELLMHTFFGNSIVGLSLSVRARPLAVPSLCVKGPVRT